VGQLDGKVAIVTGSGRGIGREVALRLARDGAAVVVNDLDEGPSKETIGLIEQIGGRAVACNGDVTAKDFGERIVGVATKQLGGLHVIVNNAGYTWDNVIQKMSDEQWYAIMDVHVTAPFGSSARSRRICASSSRRSPSAASASCARSSRSRPRRVSAATRARSTTRRPRPPSPA
jgi:3-oxoacyl-[acyl-carrier protein] reductase